MRHKILFALALQTTVSLMAASFEGEVDYELKNMTGKTQQINYQIKEPNVRINMVGVKGTGGIIFNTKQRTMIVLMSEQKMAMKRPMPEPRIPKPNPQRKKMDFVDTGKKETIAGQECNLYTYADEETTGDVCAAPGMGTFVFASGGPGNNDSGPWEAQARSKGLFPLRVSNKNLKTGKTMTMVAKRIDKKSLSAALFEIPADYKVMEGFGDPHSVGRPASPHAGAPAGESDMAQKMMNATPEERQRMIEEMRKAHGQ